MHRRGFKGKIPFYFSFVLLKLPWKISNSLTAKCSTTSCRLWSVVWHLCTKAFLVHSFFFFLLFFPLSSLDEKNSLPLPRNVGHKIKTICWEKKKKKSPPRVVVGEVIIPSGFIDTSIQLTPFFVIVDIAMFTKTHRIDTWPSDCSTHLLLELFSHVYSISDLSEVWWASISSCFLLIAITSPFWQATRLVSATTNEVPPHPPIRIMAKPNGQKHFVDTKWLSALTWFTCLWAHGHRCPVLFLAVCSGPLFMML